MLIGQLSKKTEFSRDTIRFYEKRGLIPLGVKENEFNSYKDYPNESLEKLLVIKRLKGFGFTLTEISRFLELMELNSASCENVSQKMLEKIRLIDDKIKDLNIVKDMIIDSLDSCQPQDSKLENCPIISAEI